MKTNPLLTAAATFGAGFAVAWLVKPAPVDLQEALSPPWTRLESSGGSNPGLACQSSGCSGFLQSWQNSDQDQREALLASLTAAEIPNLLGELRENAGLYEMDNGEKELFEALVKAWYLKTPAAVLAWIRSHSRADDRLILAGVIVKELMASDLGAALTLLHDEGMDEFGRVRIPDSVLENAASHGADMLVEFCRLNLGENGVYVGHSLYYPEDFNFKSALDGLVAAREAMGGEADYQDMPDLMGGWARKSPVAAWAWLQTNESIVFNGTKEFFAAYASTIEGSPEEIAGMLASGLVSEEDTGLGYENAWAALEARPSADLLDGILQSWPGDRDAHLDELFDHSWGTLGREAGIMQVRALLLERMTPARRMETMRRNNPYLLGMEMGRAFAPVLRRTGHSEEEIRTVLPTLPDP